MTEVKITKEMYEIGGRNYTHRSLPDLIDCAVVLYEGKRYQVDIVPDTDSSPFDDECYDPEDIESWRNDNWSYAGVIVTPLDVPEDKQFELSDSLWGVECNFPLNPPQTIDGVRYACTDTDYAVMVHPVPDILSNVMANVKQYETETAIQAFMYS